MPISIRNRLLLLAVLPAILLATALFITFTYETSNLVDQQMKKVDESVTKVKREELRSLMEMTYTSIKHIYENGGTFQQALPILKNLQYGENGYVFGYTGDGDRVLLGQSDKGLGNNYWDLKDDKGNYLVRGLVQAGKSDEGFFTYWFPKPGEKEAAPKQSYAIYLDRWDIMLGTGFYFDDVDEVLGAMEKSGAAQLDSSQALFSGVGVIAVVLAGLIGWAISLTISKPIASISKSVRSLSSGDADLTSRVAVTDRFELGNLAEHINKFIGTLSELVNDVKANSRKTHENAKAIQNHTRQLSELVSTQESETDQVATAVTEMTSAASEISTSAATAANSASDANAETAKSKTIISNAAAEMNALNNDIGSSAYEVEELGKGVQNIDTVIEVISSIADQTNLLALNAAIEAARAGEHGRGFSVVAEEVRNLAQKTQASTEEISVMVSDLSEKATTAVNSIRTSSERSGKALAANTEAVQAIEQVAEAINQINQMNEQVAAASEEQSSVCEDITERLVVISDKSAQTSEKGRESNVSSATLLENASALSGLVERFKTS